MSKADPSQGSTTTISDHEPDDSRWVFANPATAKGLILLVAGGIALLAPQVSTSIVRYALAVGLVVWGLTEIWAATRQWKNVGFNGLLLALVSVVTGIGILLYADVLELVLQFAGLYLVVRGLFLAAALIFRRNGNTAETIVAAVLQVSLGIMLVYLPKWVASGIFGIAGLIAVAVGAIFLYYGLRRDDEVQDLDVATLAGIFKRWLRERDLGSDQRRKIAEGLYFEAPQKREKLRAWWAMLSLSVLIATFGILQDSTAVVIGAMLIAPLMIPILGVAGAVVNGRRRRLIRSLLLVAGGAAVSVFLAFAVGRWTPDLIRVDVNSQITSRVSPNLIDFH